MAELQKSTKIKNSLSKKSPVLKKVLGSMADTKNRNRYKKAAKKAVDDRLIVFMSFMGKKYADSPRAIYEYMLNCDSYKDYRFVWAFVEPDKYGFLENNDRTIVVKHNSDKHYRYYATAKYWVTNSRVPDVIPKREAQIYVQCWHGTPLKRLGLDVDVKGANEKYSIEEMKKKYRTDALKYSYMISPSGFCTEKFVSAFGLDLVGREDIILETGYPRNDDLRNFTEEKAERIKTKLGIPKDKKVVLYAPTWRENQYSSTVGYTYKEEVDFDLLREHLGDEYVFLFRAHYFVASKFDFAKYQGFVYDVSAYDEINDLYIVADMLITDYSSVFFDYANLRRPIIFYMYDLPIYRDEMRGFYISLDELPGNIVETEETLINEIRTADNWTPDNKYDDFNKKYNPLDDGDASKRVAELVFG